MQRILITGSRTWTNRDIMFNALKDAYKSLKPNGEVTLVSGHAKGADLLAEEIWKEKVVPPHIELHPASNYDHPLNRNRAMVQLGADLCLGFVTPCSKPGCMTNRGFHYSHGTAFTIDLAEKAGINTITVTDPTLPPY